MLLNQTDVVVDEDLKKVIIPIQLMLKKNVKQNSIKKQKTKTTKKKKKKKTKKKKKKNKKKKNKQKNKNIVQTLLYFNIKQNIFIC